MVLRSLYGYFLLQVHIYSATGARPKLAACCYLVLPALDPYIVLRWFVPEILVNYIEQLALSRPVILRIYGIPPPPSTT
ncbi:hypothetical protein C8Q75DRAFT_787977 [Abortiporus biennis]|nr:hypothetical protein C8Q75DRAFT_787977 [Abortiporus biennis]